MVLNLTVLRILHSFIGHTVAMMDLRSVNGEMMNLILNAMKILVEHSNQPLSVSTQWFRIKYRLTSDKNIFN